MADQTIERIHTRADLALSAEYATARMAFPDLEASVVRLHLVVGALEWVVRTLNVRDEADPATAEWIALTAESGK